MDNRDPWLYKTTDFGKTWTKITGDLPKGPLAYARVIAENPNRKGMLFAGTGNALLLLAGRRRQLEAVARTGCRPRRSSWIVVQKQYHDLVLSTYGRGLYIMEDITPLEQGVMETGYALRGAKLVAPRPAYREVRGGRALLSYWLKAAPKHPVTNRDSGCERGGGQQAARLRGAGRAEPRERGTCTTSRRAWWRCAPLRRRIRTSGRSRASRTGHAADHALGHGAGRSGADRRRPANTP